MIHVNDINLIATLTGLGATHYRLSVNGDISLAEWKLLNENYTVEFSIPTIPGEYTVYFQLKNPYNESQVMSDVINYTPSSEIDNTPPTKPTNLVASNVSIDSFTLTWSPSFDLHLESYDVYLNGVLFGNSVTNTINITGLNADTPYTMTIVAKDLSSNPSTTSDPLIVTTTSVPVINTLVGNVLMAQVFSPSSTVVNVQDGVSIDNCFITLYNNSSTDLNLSNARLYWKYDAYPIWHQVNLSGTISSHKYFLIRGSKLTGVVEGTTILSDWNTAIPDLDCSVDWTQFVDPNPEDALNLSERMVQWALESNFLYVGSKTGVIYLSDVEVDPSTLPSNPWLEKANLPDYVDLVGLLGKDGENDIAETAPINGVKKSLICNRKQVSGVFQDTDNNSTDFETISTMLASSSEVTALIKSSRT